MVAVPEPMSKNWLSWLYTVREASQAYPNVFKKTLKWKDVSARTKCLPPKLFLNYCLNMIFNCFLSNFMDQNPHRDNIFMKIENTTSIENKNVNKNWKYYYYYFHWK